MHLQIQINCPYLDSVNEYYMQTAGMYLQMYQNAFSPKLCSTPTVNPDFENVVVLARLLICPGDI